MTQDHNLYLKQAISEAKKAYMKNEVPIGAILVDGTGKVVARAHNQTAARKDASKHAEMLVLQKAAKRVGDWRLEDMRLYVTLEPCLMCLGASLLTRVKEIHFILEDPTFGSIRSVFKEEGAKGAYKNLKFQQHPEWEAEVKKLMKAFFKQIRERGK